VDSGLQTPGFSCGVLYAALCAGCGLCLECIFARFNFHELSSGLFQLFVLFWQNPLLLACPSVALAGARHQSTELATGFNLIPRCYSTNRMTAG
jgi:hypothetical protein